MAVEPTKIVLEKEIIHKELDLIQDIVKRMATNSFQVKAWLIGILSALVVIESKSVFAQADANHTFSIEMNVFLLMPILCFWYLDAFFLSTEKLYRELYKWVVNNRRYTTAYLYDLNTFERESYDELGILKVDNEAKALKPSMIKESNSIQNMMFSKTLFPFYAVPMLFVIALMFYNYYRA